MIILKANSIEELRDSIVKYLEFEKAREHSLVDQHYDSSQRDRHGRQWRIQLLSQLIISLMDARLQQDSLDERHKIRVIAASDHDCPGAHENPEQKK